MAAYESNMAVLEREGPVAGDLESTTHAELKQASIDAIRRSFRDTVPTSKTTASVSLQSANRSRCLLAHTLCKLESRRLYPDTFEVPATRPEAENNRQPKPSSQPSDRRAFPRRDSSCVVSVCRSEVEFEPTDFVNAQLELQRCGWQLHASELKGPLADLSMNGVAFVLHEEFEDGECLLIRLKNRQLDKQLDAVARVIRCIPQDDREWKIVCRLLNNLSLEQVHEFSKRQFESAFV